MEGFLEKNPEEFNRISDLFLFCVSAGAFPLWKGKTLSRAEVERKWGSVKTFNADSFKKGSLQDRSKMAGLVLRDKTWLGKNAQEVRKILGDPDGFYFIDSYPAYFIQEGRGPKDETWQIVFRLDEKGQVRDVIVHQNCCE